MAHGKVDYDKNESNSVALIVFLILLVVFLGMTIVGVFYATNVYEDNVFAEKVREVGVPFEVQQLRNYEQEMLNNYGVVDQDKNIYRIPIDKAMEKVIKNYKKK